MELVDDSDILARSVEVQAYQYTHNSRESKC